MEAKSIMGVVSTYAELRRVVAARRGELRLSQLAVDDRAGLQDGYVSKLECGDRCFGDMSFDAVMGTLGLTFVAVRSSPAHEVGSSTIRRAAIERLKLSCQEYGRRGGKNCAGRRTNEERSKSASKAATIRWRNWRKTRPAKAKRADKATRKRQDVQPPSA